jgi:hypothetical protein
VTPQLWRVGVVTGHLSLSKKCYNIKPIHVKKLKTISHKKLPISK